MTQQEILQHLGIEQLNAMQTETQEAFRRYRDLVLLSPTGSGKTLAYLLPVVEEMMKNEEFKIQNSQLRIDHSECTINNDEDGDEKIVEGTNGDGKEEAGAQVLILVPSRELASQTAAVVKSMRCGLRAMACYGGRPAMDEHRVMRETHPHIIAATPGRAADHLRKGNLRGETFRTLVIDEFDKSLELGFHDEMAEVLSMLPCLKRRFLLSATDNEEIPAFAGKDFHRLDFLYADDRLHMHLVASPEKDKLKALRMLLCQLGDASSMVFVNHRESVERIAKYLKEEGFSISAFHGGMEQRDRERALYRFAGGAALTLISTDLAARGLDIDDVRHIIHYHLPLNEDAFTHRNGRTARWDRDGDAWVILGPEERRPEYLKADLPCTVIHTPEGKPSNEGCTYVPQPRWTTLYIGRGKKDKVNKVDIVGFLSKVGGLTREELGRIDVGDHWAYVAVDRKRVKDVLKHVQGMKIKGQKTIIAPAL